MIEVINLSKSYKKIEAVKNINFNVGVNEIIGLLGPNGCGKTTTIAMILGLLKPTKGNILVDGKNIEENLKVWQSNIGYVPQDIYQL